MCVALDVFPLTCVCVCTPGAYVHVRPVSFWNSQPYWVQGMVRNVAICLLAVIIIGGGAVVVRGWLRSGSHHNARGDVEVVSKGKME